MRELKLVKNRKTGDGANDVYMPTWPLFNLLSFFEWLCAAQTVSLQVCSSTCVYLHGLFCFRSHSNLEVLEEVVVPAEDTTVHDSQAEDMISEEKYAVLDW